MAIEPKPFSRRSLASRTGAIEMTGVQRCQPIIELLPCPFCGASDLTMGERSPSQWRAILCNECGARGPSVKIEDWEIENDWNTRAPTNEPPK